MDADWNSKGAPSGRCRIPRCLSSARCWPHAGVNYVRITMASREIFPDHRDLWPYRVVRETEDPLIPVYDLDRWNVEYWERFDRMLRETAVRGMIVEIEIWERNDLLSDRLPNEAYCLAETGSQYAVYFPDGGSVDLNVSEARGPLTIRWLDLERSLWAEPISANAEGSIRLEPPGRGHWAALILAED